LKDAKDEFTRTKGQLTKRRILLKVILLKVKENRDFSIEEASSSFENPLTISPSSSGAIAHQEQN